MSKTTPWLANVPMTGGYAPTFEPSPEDWTAIEAIVGPLDAAACGSLRTICDQYLAIRSFELDPPPAKAAFEYIRAVEEAAVSLHVALRALLAGDAAAYRVRQLFDYSLAELYYEGEARRDAGSVERIEPVVRLLAVASDRAHRKLEGQGALQGAPEIERTKPNYAWEYLIDLLAQFAEARGVKPSARTDYEGMSAFVQFVGAVHKHFPDGYRKTDQSAGALSAHISSALRERNKGPDGTA